MVENLQIRTLSEHDEPGVIALWNDVLPSSQSWNEPRTVIRRKLRAEGNVLLIDSEACAASELIFGLMKATGVEIDAEMATQIYAGIAFDTPGPLAAMNDFVVHEQRVTRTADPAVRRRTKIMLWIATAIAIVFATYPRWQTLVL